LANLPISSAWFVKKIPIIPVLNFDPGIFCGIKPVPKKGQEAKMAGQIREIRVLFRIERCWDNIL
jgi:hypothetical protein